MECPVCDDVKLVISSREGVEIDYCPQCRGVWLDRGELDKVIDRVVAGGAGGGAAAAAPSSVPPPTAAPPPPAAAMYEQPRQQQHDPRYDDRQYAQPRKKKRGSFLEDLFDF